MTDVILHDMIGDLCIEGVVSSEYSGFDRFVIRAWNPLRSYPEATPPVIEKKRPRLPTPDHDPTIHPTIIRLHGSCATKATRVTVKKPHASSGHPFFLPG
ncbi:MAG: hypothetical protein HQL99_02260 [Magnetococcales bacterium]|nr:hypothetical protein [Magnetococcales bacterium]